MWKLLGNITEMFVYSAVYMIIVLVSVKIVGAIFSTDFEKKISEEGNVGLSLICACIFVGLAILLSTIVR
ncbi:MAG: hypothetical protein NT010_01550 [Proteobacteria bacterium]|nr:hypothetical protein [Pseudomonadota bacterium]